MKKFFVLVCVLAVGFCFVLIQTPKARASFASFNNSRQIAQAVGNQDPDSPDFAPGEKDDGSADWLLDSQNPDSPNFAPGEKSDTPAPASYSTPFSNSQKSGATATLSKEDILKMTREGQENSGVGLWGTLFSSPIVLMLLFWGIGFLIFLGVIILVVILLVRRSNKKNVTPVQPVKSDSENGSKENK